MSESITKIRSAIKQLHGEGKKLSYKAIRDLAGGGSFSTIGAEITKFEKAQGASPVDTAQMVRDLGFDLVQMGTAAEKLAKEHDALAGSVALATASLDWMNAQKETLPFLMQMLQASLTSNEALQLEFNAVNEENRRLQATVAKLNEQLTSLSLDSKKKVDGMMAGFDGIQKRVMLSIDQTRQQAAEPLRILREQNQTLAHQLSSKTQAFNEQARTLTIQAETIKNLERRLAEHEGVD